MVGSGAAGVAAARALSGTRSILVLDVGHRPPPLPDTEGTLNELRQHSPDLFHFLIGERFESLHNLHHPPVSLKLKAPLMTYILRDAATLSPHRATAFQAVMSFAAGGLANAWGAGVYRFTPSDLTDFPVTRAQLDPFYDDVGAHIGISGEDDDLFPLFGHEPVLQPPVQLSRFAADLLRGYRHRKPGLAAQGISLGRTRLAVLTRPHNNRPAYRYGNYEFFRPYDRAIYNPAFTLDELIAANRIVYEPRHLAASYREHSDHVEVISRHTETGEIQRFQGRTLILAAGAINSAKLVLQSNRDHDTRLPLLDNPMACLPLFRLNRIGQALEPSDSSLGQLNLICRHDGLVLQGSIYGGPGPLRSDLIFQLPFAIGANLSLLRRLAVATGLLMMFYPCDPVAGNDLRLAPDGVLEIRCGTKPSLPARDVLLKAMRSMGCVASSAMWQYPAMGAGIHYAGTLPMRTQPGRYQLDPAGRLSGTRRIFVADGAAFPRLPAKNLTYTIMANAARIASSIPFEAL